MIDKSHVHDHVRSAPVRSQLRHHHPCGRLGLSHRRRSEHRRHVPDLHRRPGRRRDIPRSPPCAGDANHLPSDGAAVPIEINKANATVVVIPYSVTYGNSRTATACKITGVGTDHGRRRKPASRSPDTDPHRRRDILGRRLVAPAAPATTASRATTSPIPSARPHPRPPRSVPRPSPTTPRLIWAVPGTVTALGLSNCAARP